MELLEENYLSWQKNSYMAIDVTKLQNATVELHHWLDPMMEKYVTPI